MKIYTMALANDSFIPFTKEEVDTEFKCRVGRRVVPEVLLRANPSVRNSTALMVGFGTEAIEEANVLWNNPDAKNKATNLLKRSAEFEKLRLRMRNVEGSAAYIPRDHQLDKSYFNRVLIARSIADVLTSLALFGDEAFFPGSVPTAVFKALAQSLLTPVDPPEHSWQENHSFVITLRASVSQSTAIGAQLIQELTDLVRFTKLLSRATTIDQLESAEGPRGVSARHHFLASSRPSFLRPALPSSFLNDFIKCTPSFAKVKAEISDLRRRYSGGKSLEAAAALQDAAFIERNFVKEIFSTWMPFVETAAVSRLKTLERMHAFMNSPSRKRIVWAISHTHRLSFRFMLTAARQYDALSAEEQAAAVNYVSIDYKKWSADVRGQSSAVPSPQAAPAPPSPSVSAAVVSVQDAVADLRQRQLSHMLAAFGDPYIVKGRNEKSNMEAFARIQKGVAATAMAMKAGIEAVRAKSTVFYVNPNL